MALHRLPIHLVPHLLYPHLTFTDILSFSITSATNWKVLQAHRRTTKGKTLIIDRIKAFFDGYKELGSSRLCDLMLQQKALYSGGSLLRLLVYGHVVDGQDLDIFHQADKDWTFLCKGLDGCLYKIVKQYPEIVDFCSFEERQEEEAQDDLYHVHHGYGAVSHVSTYPIHHDSGLSVPIQTIALKWTPLLHISLCFDFDLLSNHFDGRRLVINNIWAMTEKRMQRTRHGRTELHETQKHRSEKYRTQGYIVRDHDHSQPILTDIWSSEPNPKRVRQV